MSSPGAAFYFTTFTAAADAGGSPIVVKIQQSSTGGSQYLMALTQVSVYGITGTAGDLHCTTLISNASFSTLADGIQFTLPDSFEGPAGRRRLLVRARPRSPPGRRPRPWR